MDRHDSAWALRDKAVLIRNRRESRFGSETMLRTADLAYVVRTEDDYTTRVRVVSTPPEISGPVVVIFPSGMAFLPRRSRHSSGISCVGRSPLFSTKLH